MTDAVQQEIPQEPKKRGTKPKVDPVIQDLQDQIDNLKACIGKMAHHSGGAIPSVCREFGIDTYKPQKKDMTKYT